MVDTIHGRRTRKAYLLAEALVDLPMHALLGVPAAKAREARGAQRAANGAMQWGQIFARARRNFINAFTGRRGVSSSLPDVRLTFPLEPPKRGTAAAATVYAQKRQKIQVSITFHLEVSKGECIRLPSISRYVKGVHPTAAAVIPHRAPRTLAPAEPGPGGQRCFLRALARRHRVDAPAPA